MDQGVLCERLLELVLGQESAHPVLDSDNVAGFLALLVFLTVSLLVDHFVHHFGLDSVVVVLHSSGVVLSKFVLPFVIWLSILCDTMSICLFVHPLVLFFDLPW